LQDDGTDLPNSRSPVSKQLKPQEAAASSKSPLAKVPQPWALAVSAGIPNSSSKSLSCRGMFTSSSRMWGIQQLGSRFQDFRNSLVGKRAVAHLELLGTHPFREAGENQGCRKTSAPNRGFAAEHCRIRHYPTIVFVGTKTGGIHGLSIAPRTAFRETRAVSEVTSDEV